MRWITTLMAAAALSGAAQAAENAQPPADADPAQWPQLADDPNAPVHEALPQVVPEHLAARIEMPPLQSADRAEAWEGARNIHELAALGDEELKAATQAWSEKTADLPLPPPRLGMIRAATDRTRLDDTTAVRTTLADGRTMWTMAVRSPGAFGIRLKLAEFDAGDGYVLVYGENADGRIAHGPYRQRGPDRDGDFWTPSLPGDTAYIEFVGVERPKLKVAEVFHFDADPAGFDCSDGVGTCHLDVMCEPDPPVNVFARNATGRIAAISGCTGTVLVDLDDQTAAPYFLTAYHCGVNEDNVDMIEVVWLWQSDFCGGPIPNYFALPRSIGGTLLEENPTSGGNDMTFIRLNDALPPNVTMAGWTTSTSINGIGIHHPCGSHKRATYYDPVGFCPFECACFDPTDYDYYDTESDGGTVQPGSSGSGIFTSGGLLAGQLFGFCCGVSCDASCENPNNDTYVYGEFQTTYPIIETWLEIGGTINVNGAFNGSELGTPSQPFDTVIEGYNFAWDGSRIRIQAGNYDEAITLNKAITALASGGLVRIGQ